MRLTRHTEAETFNRKEMVKALGEYLGVRPHYEGMPSKAYTVGAFTVDFEGAIIGDDFTPIREFLISEGYAQPDDFEAPAEAEAEEAEAHVEESPIAITDTETETAEDTPLVSITFPVPDMTVPGLRNLVFMLYTKQVLLNHALGLDVLTIDKNLISRLQEYTPASMEEFSVILKDAHGLDMLEGFMYEDGKVTMTFPRDKENPTEWALFGKLFKLIVDCAQSSTCTHPVLQTPDNERYYMHSWLIRLGCGGTEHKALRRRMIQKLDGYCAFPDETRAQKHRDKYKEIRRIRREVNEEADRR
jgi:hypothetical protein